MKLLNLGLIMGWKYQCFCLLKSSNLNLLTDIFNTNMKFLKQSIYEFNCGPFSLSNCTFVNLKNKWGLSLTIKIKLCAFILDPNFDYFYSHCMQLIYPTPRKKKEEHNHKLMQYINRISIHYFDNFTYKIQNTKTLNTVSYTHLTLPTKRIV